MNKHLNRNTFLNMVVAIVAIAFTASNATAQQAALGKRFQVDDSVDQLEIISGSARRLKFKHDVPELVVENPEILQATPVSPNEILLSGIKPGVSTLTVSDADKNLQMINVEVKVDTRKLEMAFRNYFPDSQIRVHPLQTGVILAGHVARADQVANIMATARDFFPTNVINQLRVNGNQNIAIKVKVYEVSRTKLRQLGIDWSYLGDEFSIVSSVSQIIQAFDATGPTAGANTLAFGVVDDGGTRFDSFIQTLERHSIAKLLDQPILVAQNGRPAEFLSGGEIPILIPAGLGTATVEFRAFGTKLDMVPIVHGNGELTLEVRAEVSEVAQDLGTADGTPGFRVRRVNTGVKMKAGHTLALAGDYREDHAATKQGLPGIMHNPVFGPLFRTVQDETNETELVFLITPRFISDVDPASAPQLGPGQMTVPPSTRELMIDGYLEVPRCADDCPIPQRDNGFQFQNQAAPVQGGQMDEGTFQQVGQNIQPAKVNPYPAPPMGPQVEAVQANSKPSKAKSFLQRLGIGKSSNAQQRQASNGFMWPNEELKR